jgi:hypothetical protein
MGPFLLSIFLLALFDPQDPGVSRCTSHFQLGEWGQTSSTIILEANQYHCVEIENNVEMLVSIMGMKIDKLQESLPSTMSPTRGK